jgi:regulator of ribonuclease activity A
VLYYRCALVGDNLASFGIENGWKGVVVNGCVRDIDALLDMDFGVKALAPHPLKGVSRDPGIQGVPVSFGGVTIRPGQYIYCDSDGIVVSDHELE